MTNFTSMIKVQEQIGTRIAKQRVSLNLTQKDMAEKSGVSLRSVINLEKGKDTNTSTLYRVLGALNLLNNMEYIVPEPLPSPY